VFVDIFPSLPSTTFTPSSDASTEHSVEHIENVDVYHHHRFVNRATLRNFTLLMIPILQVIVPQTTR
jgi:hypothetical protein